LTKEELDACLSGSAAGIVRVVDLLTGEELNVNVSGALRNPEYVIEGDHSACIAPAAWMVTDEQAQRHGGGSVSPHLLSSTRPMIEANIMPHFSIKSMPGHYAVPRVGEPGRGDAALKGYEAACLAAAAARQYVRSGALTASAAQRRVMKTLAPLWQRAGSRIKQAGARRIVRAVFEALPSLPDDTPLDALIEAAPGDLETLFPSG
jgi:hypothetical protein